MRLPLYSPFPFDDRPLAASTTGGFRFERCRLGANLAGVYTIPIAVNQLRFYRSGDLRRFFDESYVPEDGRLT